MDNARRARQAFAAVTTLLFVWGFIISVIDPLATRVEHVFALTNVEAQLSAFAFFISYGIVSLPAASLIARIGQLRTILMAPAMMAGGLDVDAGAAALGQVGRSFLAIAGLLTALLLFVWAMRHRLATAKVADSVPPAVSLMAVLQQAVGSPRALARVMAIFIYVGADVAIGSQIALSLHDPTVRGIAIKRASYFISLYWLGAMLGRFAGSALLIVFPASRLLGLAALGAAPVSLFVLLAGGVAGGWVALAIGLMNAVMFAVIFTLMLERSGASEEATAGLPCTAIVGGAFVLLAIAATANRAGYVAAFLIPVICYALLVGFAWAAGRMTGAPTQAVPASALDH